MPIISTLFAWVALLLSVLALFSYQWVSFLPQLGIETLFYMKKIRVAIASVAIVLALLGWSLTPTLTHLVQLLIVLLLTPLSGFFYAGRVLVAVNSPKHVYAKDARLAEEAMVLGLELGSSAHAWTVETLVPHHLVNDEIDLRPVVATW